MELLSYDFVQRGIVTGVLIAFACSVAGVFLILKRMAFLGAGLSHASFGGIALAMLLGVEPFIFTALFTLMVGNLVQFLSSRRHVPGDTAIALVFSGGVSLAVLVLGIVKGFGENVFSYLFGSILMVTREEMFFALVLTVLSLAFFALSYKKLVLVTFSEEIARLRGVRIALLNHTFISVSSLVIVLSVKAVGIVLASSMLVVPALKSLLVARSFFMSIVLSVIVSLTSTVAGLAVAFYYNLPPSGSIVGVMILFFALAFAVRGLRA